MTVTLQAEKARLRRELCARRRAVPKGEAERAAQDAARHLLADSAIEHARRVALYASLPDELPSRPLYEALAGAGRSLLFPRVAAGRRLAFASVRRWGELAPGHFGVPEPPPEATAERLGPEDVVLVPLVAFDAAGHRLGRGQGYYDRTFPPRAEAPLLFGVGYAFQEVAAVPSGSRDRRMDAIVTERGVLRVTGERV
jgi:5-formyltetrahydrofolate cyclo-ligase